MRYNGFDYLRVVMSIAVVAWHTGLILCSTTGMFGRDARIIKVVISDISNFNLQLLAVPIFYLIALFLTAKKLIKTHNPISERIWKLLYLYVFWSLIWVLYNHGIWWFVNLLSYDFKSIIRVMLGSDFGVFYFIHFLIYLTVIVKYIYKMPIKYLKIMTIYSVFFAVMGPMIVVAFSRLFILVNYLNFLTYLPYAFIAVSLARLEESGELSHKLKYYVLYLLFMYVFFAAYEWQFLLHNNFIRANGYAFPPYARLSVIAGATMFFLLSFYIKRRAGFIVKFLSDHSLGLYCIHPFTMILFRGYMSCKPCYVAYVVVSALALSVFMRKAFAKNIV